MCTLGRGPMSWWNSLSQLYTYCKLVLKLCARFCSMYPGKRIVTITYVALLKPTYSFPAIFLRKFMIWGKKTKRHSSGLNSPTSVRLVHSKNVAGKLVSWFHKRYTRHFSNRKNIQKHFVMGSSWRHLTVSFKTKPKFLFFSHFENLCF